MLYDDSCFDHLEQYEASLILKNNKKSRLPSFSAAAIIEGSRDVTPLNMRFVRASIDTLDIHSAIALFCFHSRRLRTLEKTTGGRTFRSPRPSLR